MSTIEFNCSSCGYQYKVPQSAVGRRAKCKQCGAAMVVPGAKEDDFVELREIEDQPAAPRPAPSAQKGSGGRPKAARNEGVDLAALYSAEPDAVEEESVFEGFAAGPSFDTAPTRTRSAAKKKKSGLPMALLLGGLGGAVALLAVVVVIVIVISGGGDGDDTPVTPGLGISASDAGTSTAKPTPNRFTLNNRNNARDDDDTDTDTETDEPVDDVDEQPVPRLVAIPSDDAALANWTLKVDSSVAEAARQIARAGVLFTAPTTWKEQSKPSDDGTPQIRDIVALSPDESITISVTVGKYGTTSAPTWPSLLTVDRTPTDRTQEELLFGRPEPWKGPNEFMLTPDYVSQEASFGTMLGGYRFTRFALHGTRTDNTRVDTVHYLGSVGSLYVHIAITGENADAKALAEAEWIARSARLMNDTGLSSYAKKNTLFQDWLRDPNTTIPRLQDAPPVASAQPGEWPGFDAGSDFEKMMAMAGAAGPSRSPYRVAPPAGLGDAVTSRLAVRWHPSETGLWMAMEVRDLGSRWRRKDSPVLDAGHAMIAGREVLLPEGSESSTLEINGLTVHRFLFPEQPEQPTRQVYYVVLDRGVLVTVEGRFANDRPEDLKLLDAAAQTLTKS